MTSLLVLAVVFFAWPRGTAAGRGPGRGRLHTDDPTEAIVSERSHG
jgi:hypothetical protein